MEGIRKFTLYWTTLYKKRDRLPVNFSCMPHATIQSWFFSLHASSWKWTENMNNNTWTFSGIKPKIKCVCLFAIYFFDRSISSAIEFIIVVPNVRRTFLSIKYTGNSIFIPYFNTAYKTQRIHVLFKYT